MEHLTYVPVLMMELMNNMNRSATTADSFPMISVSHREPPTTFLNVEVLTCYPLIESEPQTYFTDLTE